MSPWKQLPTSLDPRTRQLVLQLRRVKDHSGLSQQALAARTGYSRSSWDRYLNGRALPPQRAVAAFARACATDPGRLLALHEVAAAALGGGAARNTRGESKQAHTPEDPEERDEPGERDEPAQRDESGESADVGKGARDDRPQSGRRLPWLPVLAAASVTALLALIALLVAAPWDHGGAPDRPAAAAGSSATNQGGDPFVFRAGKDYSCAVRRDKDGLLYAGYSTTRTALIGTGSAQWPVVEAQCLLRHHGFPPGLADGAFGSGTERAVERLQQDAHIVVDGVIGEDTWEVLRHDAR
ncbi:helix-turn-helix domain-containing protein [Streptomyces sp. NPDC052043]|uniref:helix-turn-helix domain-containing protein n=1 Tax=Streptomyces sp. NPDC052043 TaxID=3365684 RepID=UPI0037D18A89